MSTPTQPINVPSLNPNPISHHSSAYSVLSHLHALSLSQERGKGNRGKHFPRLPGFEHLPGDARLGSTEEFVEELVALDEDKALAVYMILRGMGARRVVEAGTSYGVSLIYLLCAVLDNITGETPDAYGSGSNLPPLVVGTELEPAKVAKALAHVKEAFPLSTHDPERYCQVPQILNLLQGDLLQTIPSFFESTSLPDQSIDALLLDIWAPLARPMLELILPKLRRGAVVFLDNSMSSRDRYKDILEFLKGTEDSEGRRLFKCVTLPFEGGLEMCIYEGQ
ncbi:hypothetical protein D9758_012459 [Tetrapyrgos nigripes]|uniref:O-methyltransferase n=1 Tax=Tetrapyrgos nigripes TaxID=182062 RepID=A0A8H5CYN1_9AGAR|nr:hypothetical protein D9758_012459 [Tetrapyrgos nigripes]